MNVLLLNPVTRDGTVSLRIGRCQGKVIVGLWPNIEYGYLAPLLRAAQFQVQLVDANQEGLGYEAMLRRAVAERPDIVFVLSITATIADDLDIGQRLRAALPGVAIVYWGTHASVRPADYLGWPGTFVVRREPDVTAPALCRALRDGATAFDEVAGVSWRSRTGELRHAPDRPLLDDLDSLPLADHDIMRTGVHLAADTRRPFALIKASRGCPHQCVFCTVHSFFGDRWRPRATESIVAEVKHVVRTRGVRDFFFQSDVFSRGHAWTEDLCARLQRENLGITWFCNSRVDTLDEALLREMKGAGCRLVALGVESGSDTVLRAIRKGTDSARAARTIEACRRVGIASLTYWVFGLPGETPATIRETLAFVRRTHPDYAHFYSPTPLPGSRLYEQLEIGRRVEAGELAWSDFFQGVSPAFVAPELTPRDVQHALYRAYAAFYSDPRRIVHELRSIRDFRNLYGKFYTLYTMARNYAIKR